MISGIGQIEVAVRDMSRAVEFYRSRLGLRLLFEPADPCNSALFDCGGVRLALRRVEEGAGNSTVYFKVGDLESAAAELKSRGVVFEREPHLVAHFPEHDLFMALFRDPEGNAIGLMSEARR